MLTRYLISLLEVWIISMNEGSTIIKKVTGDFSRASKRTSYFQQEDRWESWNAGKKEKNKMVVAANIISYS